jgi:type II secretory ATPase GspE/PulE/Tfp pilus assembly ATPase PilB-like protein
LGLSANETNTQSFRKGRGCTQCFETGYLGREALIELLNVDDRVRQIIYEGSLTQLNHYLNGIDYPCFRMAAIAKVTEGVTTIEEIKRVIPSSALIQRTGKSPREDVGLRAIG